MPLIKKYRWEIVLISLTALVFAISRFTNLLSVPIFTDEAIYLRWAQIAKNDAAWRFISLTDGKQPLFIWLVMIAMRFIDDPLLSGRIVSVFAGFTSMIGLFMLAKELFRNRWIGILAAALYSVYPFALVYDRLALYDSLVGTFAVWSLYFTVLLVRTLRLDIALVLGMILGGGALNKTSGFISATLLPFTLILFDFVHRQRFRLFMRWAILALVAVALMYAYYSILRLSPFFHIIDEKNTIFYYPLSEWIKHPFTNIVSNWRGLFNWFTTYVSWPWLFLVIAAFFVDRSYLREKAILVISFLFPFVVLTLIGKTIYPRFIFFMTLPLLPLIAFSLWKLSQLIKNKLLLASCFLLLALLPIRADYLVLTDFARSPIPRSDLDQYVNDWPAGGGIKEAIAFFQKESEKRQIYIATQGSFGLLPYAFELYLGQNPNVKIVGFWPLNDLPPAEVVEVSRTVPVYFVFYQPCAACDEKGFAPRSWTGRVVAQYQKGIYGNVYLSIYQILP